VAHPNPGRCQLFRTFVQLMMERRQRWVGQMGASWQQSIKPWICWRSRKAKRVTQDRPRLALKWGGMLPAGSPSCGTQRFSQRLDGEPQPHWIHVFIIAAKSPGATCVLQPPPSSFLVSPLSPAGSTAIFGNFRVRAAYCWTSHVAARVWRLPWEASTNKEAGER
jgi:hypothetical protein